MSKDLFARRLRLHLFSAYARSQCLRHTRSFAHPPVQSHSDRDVTLDFTKRVEQLRHVHEDESKWHPRLPQAVSDTRTRRNDLYDTYRALQPDETARDEEKTLAGRIESIRTAGSKLVFVDIQLLDGSAQAVLNVGELQRHSNVTQNDLKAFARLARKGDVYSITGHPHRTARGELSILATELPSLLSPSLHQIPEILDDAETRARHRHVDMLVNTEAVQTMRVRHEVEAGLQKFLNDRGFVKVNTPILSSMAGGAAARPFQTQATELEGERLHLRIAPELWLKRLVVGGMERVYEIGPAFRNEGVDSTHNPEFSICEFYQAYATLPDLIKTTEAVITALVERITNLEKSGQISALLDLREEFMSSSKQVEFIPGLEEKLAQKLPDLSSQSTARDALLRIFEERGLKVPQTPSLSRLLDDLSARYLEPESHEQPLFITHHPACMSPLSKHFVCPRTGHRVAARAELFICGREYANMYEEENNPFEQRRKFEEQLERREVDDEAMELDESYLRALEWGMPPTGGWGCGIDRLVMLLSGRERIADVLPFGNLRNVVGLGSLRR